MYYFGKEITTVFTTPLTFHPGLPTLTHMAWFSRISPVTHALTQLTNLLTHLKKITRILTQFKKIENILLFFYHCKTDCNIVYCFLAAESFVVSFIQVFSVGKSKKCNKIIKKTTISLYSAEIFGIILRNIWSKYTPKRTKLHHFSKFSRRNLPSNTFAMHSMQCRDMHIYTSGKIICTPLLNLVMYAHLSLLSR